MKITLLTYTYWPPDFGGELLASIERLRAAFPGDVVVLTSGRPGYPQSSRDRGLNIRRSAVIGVSRPARVLRRMVFIFWGAWQTFRSAPDILHLGSLPGVGPMTSALAGCLFCCAAALHGTRTVTVHSLADTEQEALLVNGWKGFWQRLFLKCVNRIVVVSPALYAGVARYFPSKTTLIPYGVRDDVFRRSADGVRQALRRDKGAAQDDVIFCFLGTIGYRKGFDVLARVFAELAAERPGWKLWVVGPRGRGQNQNINEHEVEEVTKPFVKVTDKVVFWGRVDDRFLLSQILSASDVFVFPSRREGMPIAPMEAMAVGLPVIVSRIPGVTDLVNIEGETGYYVPPGDLDALKRAMVSLGEDHDIRRRMGEKASQVVRGRFGWDAYLSRWTDLYADSLRVVTLVKNPAPGSIAAQA